MTRLVAGAVTIISAYIALGACGAQSISSTACDAGSRQLVESFVRSFNSGNAEELDNLVAESGRGFSWYSTDAPGERINDEARDRSSLLAYFADRHKHRERLELRSFQFNGYSANGRGNFGFELTRSSDDGLASTPYVGKGAIDCDRSPFTLVVWSMAREPFLRADLPRNLALVAVLAIALAAGVIAVLRRRRLRQASIASTNGPKASNDTR